MSEQLSALDTMFLDLEQADDGATMHFGAVLIFDPLPGGGTPDIADVRAHIDHRLHAVPHYRMQLSRPRASRLSWTTWEPAPHFDIAAHVGHATLPAPGGDAELHEWFGDFLSHRLDRRRPLWETVLLDGLERGRWALATKTHHCLVDGMGSVDVGEMLLDAERAPKRHREPPHWTIPHPSDADHRLPGSGLPGALVRGAKAGASTLRHTGDLLGQAVGIADLVVHEELIAAPHTSLNGPLGATRSYIAVPFALNQLKAIKNVLGGTINDLVLAISAGGLRRLLLARGELPPAAGLRAQIPVNIRTREHERGAGNVLTSLFVELPVAEPDPLLRHRQLVARAQSLKSSPQPVGGKALVDLAGLAPPLLGEILGRAMFGGDRVFNLTITNVRASAEPQYAFGARLRSVLPYVPLFAGHAVGIAVVSYANTLVFGLGADRDSTSDLDVLADGVRTSFGELRRATSRPGSATWVEHLLQDR
ncbi:MAG TPA: wax ester/triacylglycerol synthase family O-acyltransferase [Solirubrobacteraceae bacterium]|nr:wax ester/triacylglycerol synthase family O-acyltransferase [Solirubrobacteraceae bacterium]